MANKSAGSYKKNSGTKKNTNPQKKKPTAAAKAAPQSAPVPHFQTAWPYAIVCVLLALLAILGFFPVDGFVIDYFCAFVKGVIGYGFWLFPFALLLLAWTLVGKNRRRIVLRIVSILLLPLLFGTLLHLILCRSAFTTADFGAVISELYSGGKALTCGGVLSGGLGILLKAALSVYASVPVVLLAFLYVLMCSLNLTLAKIIGWFHDRAESKYIPDEEIIPDEDEADAVPLQPVPELPGSKRKKAAEKPVAQKKFIDIPVDSEVNLETPVEPLPVTPAKSRAKSKAGAATKDV